MTMTCVEEREACEKVRDLVHRLYQTNNGPRLVAEVMAEYPNPRRLRNGPGLFPLGELGGVYVTQAIPAPE